jgi:hypothetical protein
VEQMVWPHFGRTSGRLSTWLKSSKHISHVKTLGFPPPGITGWPRDTLVDVEGVIFHSSGHKKRLHIFIIK